MPAYLLGPDGKTSDVIGAGASCCRGGSRVRGLGPGDEMRDRFSLVVDGVIGCDGLADDVSVEAGTGGGNWGGFLEEPFAVISDD